MFRRATRVAVHFARGALALAVFFAASRGFPLSRLVVARAIPIASRAFATVALRAAVLATAIVVDTATTMASISAVDDVVASIVAKSNLAFGTLAAPAVGGLAEPSGELLRSFAKETLADTVRLFAFARTTRCLASMTSFRF